MFWVKERRPECCCPSSATPLRRNRMWNKREENDSPRTVTLPPTTAVATRHAAIVGASMQIKGEIRSREELVIEGEVDGIVESQSAITIGPNGKVKANIKA